MKHDLLSGLKKNSPDTSVRTHGNTHEGQLKWKMLGNLLTCIFSINVGPNFKQYYKETTMTNYYLKYDCLLYVSKYKGCTILKKQKIKNKEYMLIIWFTFEMCAVWIS